jgi:hypothetical protein
MSNAVPTPRQTFTLKHSQENIEKILMYICEELPTYKFLNKNDTLNSLRIQITRGIQPQHLDFRFQETEDDKSVFEIEVSKHTGGMTNDDSMLYAKRNLEECVDFLIKCLDGYKITEEDKSKAKNNQTLNVVLVIVVTALFVWWIGSGIWW